MDLCWQSNVSAFYMLSRLVIAFLPRSKCLNFMAAVTICSDFGAQKSKVSHCFHCFPIYLPWSNRTRQRRQWHPTPVLFPGKSHGQRSLVVCSPWGRKELDTTERLHFHFSLSCIGEGNGNPLQCSSLENPRDGKSGGLPSMGRTESDTTEVT